MTQALSKVMVVDDNDRNLRVIEGILDDQYDLSFASAGEACIALAQRQQPDLILLDIMMPGIDGFETCLRLKQADQTKDIPVVFVSGRDSLDDRIRGFDIGAEDYFVKPFNHDDLVLKIKKVLADRAERKQLAQYASEASSMAMKLMRDVGSMGVITRFFEASFALESHEQLIEKLFETTTEFGWVCSVQIRSLYGTYNASSTGNISSLEESLLTRTQEMGRLIDFNQRTIVNYEHISLLIKNMPVDDPHLYGTVRDNVCLLLNGAEARATAIDSERQLSAQRESILSSLNTFTSSMDELRRGYHAMRMEGATIVEDMVQAIENLTMGLALTVNQETALTSIGEQGLRRTNELFDRGIGIDSAFSKLQVQLNQLLRSST